MAMSNEQLAQILNKSKVLCSEQGDRLINKHTSKGKVNDVSPNDYSDEWDNIGLNEITDNGILTSSAPKQYLPNSFSNETIMNSGLPDAVKKSFMENKIDTAIPDAATESLASVTQMLAQKKQPVNEVQNRQMVQQPVSSIDYNYLKYIVSECISEYFSKNPINENKSRLKQVSIFEDKIKLVDTDGNIYSAPLELVGNIKDLKKK